MNWYWYERTANERINQVARDAERRRRLDPDRLDRRLLGLHFAPSIRAFWRVQRRADTTGFLPPQERLRGSGEPD
jgi:hypothetical protein